MIFFIIVIQALVIKKQFPLMIFYPVFTVGGFVGIPLVPSIVSNEEFFLHNWNAFKVELQVAEGAGNMCNK